MEEIENFYAKHPMEPKGSMLSIIHAIDYHERLAHRKGNYPFTRGRFLEIVTAEEQIYTPGSRTARDVWGMLKEAGMVVGDKNDTLLNVDAVRTWSSKYDYHFLTDAEATQEKVDRNVSA